jgi:iron(III) transport system substrate-binding protein
MFKLLAIIITLLSFQTLANEVNLYSAQKEYLIRPILNKFEKNTGIKVNMVTIDKAALISRLKNEGKNTLADLVLTVDIGNIYQLKKNNLLQSVNSKIIKKQIPKYLRDPDNMWFGLTMRFRAIFYNKDKVAAGEIANYEDLSDPKWRNSLLIRSSSNIYNQSLVASFLAHNGEAETKKWLKSLVANMARNPQGGDSSQIKALAAGEGKIAIANSYYFGKLTSDKGRMRNKLVKDKVKIILPNQDNRGAHVNIRGGGVTKYAKNKENAIKLLEFLASDEAQSFFANINFEYPVSKNIAIPDSIKQWGGNLKSDQINLEEIAVKQEKAIYLMDQAGWR